MIGWTEVRIRLRLFWAKQSDRQRELTDEHGGHDEGRTAQFTIKFHGENLIRTWKFELMSKKKDHSALDTSMSGANMPIATRWTYHEMVGCNFLTLVNETGSEINLRSASHPITANDEWTSIFTFVKSTNIFHSDDSKFFRRFME